MHSSCLLGLRRWCLVEITESGTKVQQVALWVKNAQCVGSPVVNHVKVFVVLQLREGQLNEIARRVALSVAPTHLGPSRYVICGPNLHSSYLK